MSNFRSNLGACIKEMTPFWIAAGFAILFLVYAFAILFLVYVLGGIALLLGMGATPGWAIIIGTVLGVAMLPVICAAWKTWGRHWFSRENER